MTTSAYPDAPEEVPFDEMKIKHIQAIREVEVLAAYAVPGDTTAIEATNWGYDDFRGMVKTREDLIGTVHFDLSRDDAQAVESPRMELLDRHRALLLPFHGEPHVLLTSVYGYVCTQPHQTDEAIVSCMEAEARESFAELASSDVETHVGLGPEHGLNTYPDAQTITNAMEREMQENTLVAKFTN